MDLFPEGQKIQDLAVGLLPLDIGGGIDYELGVGVLGKEGKRPFHHLVAGTGPMFLQHRLIAEMGHGMEIEIDDLFAIEPQGRGLFDKGLLQALGVTGIQGVAVGGQSGAFGQDVKAGEQSQAGIEGMVADMGEPFGAQQLQGQQREKIVGGGKRLGSGQSGDYPLKVKLGQKRNEEKNPGPGGLPLTAAEFGQFDSFRLGRHLGILDGQPDLEAGAPGQFGKPFLGQYPLDGADGNFNPVFAEELGDFSGRELLFAPGDDLAPDFGGDLSPLAPVFGSRFRQINFPVPELVGQQTHVGRRIIKLPGDHPRRLALDKDGPQGFVSPLPLGVRMEEERSIAHVDVIN